MTTISALIILLIFNNFPTNCHNLVKYYISVFGLHNDTNLSETT